MAHLSILVRTTPGGPWHRGAGYNAGMAPGRGRIADVVLIKGDPVDTPYPGGCLVRLYRELDGVLMRQTWSHPVTGVYQFLWVDPHTRYTAIAYDHQDHYRVVGANNLSLGQGVELIP